MIESTKFNKMLHILKQNADDVNISICIIGYDIAKECDYEVITLHLKETNTQNNASVYKDLIIRSQLYYDEIDDKYYSALDGDILVEGKALTKLSILTDIDKDTFNTFSDDSDTNLVHIDVSLVDAETLEPLKNQIVYMYLSISPGESIASANTHQDGIARFDLNLSDINMLTGEYIIYFEYKGNRTYRKSLSNYILINFEDIKNQYIESDIETYIEADESLMITYNTSFNHTNWVDGFKQYSSLSVDETDLTQGIVWFYLIKNNIRMLLGGNYLTNTTDKTYTSILTSFPKGYYNQDIIIEAVFEGNNYFSPSTTTTPLRLNRVIPTNIELQIVDMNANNINIIDEAGFKTKLTFDIDTNEINMDNSLYEPGLNELYQVFGEVQFYLCNNDGKWGTLIKELPFYISDNLIIESTNNISTISTETDLLTIDLDNYGLRIGDPLYIKAEYSGNAIINDFAIDNKTQAPRGNSER